MTRGRGDAVEVGMWMARDPWTVEPDAPVSEAAHAMAMHRVRRLPVTAAGSRGAHLVGIVSSHDVWLACPAGHHPLSAAGWPAASDVPVHSVMARDVATTTPTTPIEVAAALLRQRRIGALPVVEDGRLVGIITESDVLDVLLETIGVGQRGVRVSLEIDDAEARDPVRALVELAARHGARLASVLTLRRRDPESGMARTLGAIRLVGDAPQALLDELARDGARVRRVTRAG